MRGYDNVLLTRPALIWLYGAARAFDLGWLLCVLLRQTQKTTPEVHEGKEVMKERKADGKPKQTVAKKRRRVRKENRGTVIVIATNQCCKQKNYIMNLYNEC